MIMPHSSGLPATWQPSIDTQRASQCSDNPSLPLCQEGIYSYILNRNANMAFTVLFAMATVSLICIGLAKRRAFIYTVAVFAGLALETTGYAARVWSCNNQLDIEPFYMQIVCLTVGPAFLAAAIYLCMRYAVLCFGPEYSPIFPKNFTRIFIPCDLVSLILQATGGALAAKAHRAHDQSDLDKGTAIMIAGLAFQVCTMCAFGFLGLRFLWVISADHQVRVRDRMVLNPYIVAMRTSAFLRVFVWGILWSTMLIFVRCCYRVAELSGGWSGDLMKDQNQFIVCEGVLILIASVILTSAHPAMAAPTVLEAGGQLGSPLSKLRCFRYGEKGSDEESGQRVGSKDQKERTEAVRPVILPHPPQPQSNPIATMPGLSA